MWKPSETPSFDDHKKKHLTVTNHFGVQGGKYDPLSDTPLLYWVTWSWESVNKIYFSLQWFVNAKIIKKYHKSWIWYERINQIFVDSNKKHDVFCDMVKEMAWFKNPSIPPWFQSSLMTIPIWDTIDSGLRQNFPGILAKTCWFRVMLHQLHPIIPNVHAAGCEILGLSWYVISYSYPIHIKISNFPLLQRFAVKSEGCRMLQGPGSFVSLWHWWPSQATCSPNVKASVL